MRSGRKSKLHGPGRGRTPVAPNKDNLLHQVRQVVGNGASGTVISGAAINTMPGFVPAPLYTPRAGGLDEKTVMDHFDITGASHLGKMLKDYASRVIMMFQVGVESGATFGETFEAVAQTGDPDHAVELKAMGSLFQYLHHQMAAAETKIIQASVAAANTLGNEEGGLVRSRTDRLATSQGDALNQKSLRGVLNSLDQVNTHLNELVQLKQSIITKLSATGKTVPMGITRKSSELWSSSTTSLEDISAEQAKIALDDDTNKKLNDTRARAKQMAFADQLNSHHTGSSGSQGRPPSSGSLARRVSGASSGEGSNTQFSRGSPQQQEASFTNATPPSPRLVAPATAQQPSQYNSATAHSAIENEAPTDCETRAPQHTKVNTLPSSNDSLAVLLANKSLPVSRECSSEQQLQGPLTSAAAPTSVPTNLIESSDGAQPQSSARGHSEEPHSLAPAPPSATPLSAFVQPQPPASQQYFNANPNRAVTAGNPSPKTQQASQTIQKQVSAPQKLPASSAQRQFEASANNQNQEQVSTRHITTTQSVGLSTLPDVDGLKTQVFAATGDPRLAAHLQQQELHQRQFEEREREDEPLPEGDSAPFSSPRQGDVTTETTKLPAGATPRRLVNRPTGGLGSLGRCIKVAKPREAGIGLPQRRGHLATPCQLRTHHQIVTGEETEEELRKIRNSVNPTGPFQLYTKLMRGFNHDNSDTLDKTANRVAQTARLPAVRSGRTRSEPREESSDKRLQEYAKQLAELRAEYRQHREDEYDTSQGVADPDPEGVQLRQTVGIQQVVLREV